MQGSARVEPLDMTTLGVRVSEPNFTAWSAISACLLEEIERVKRPLCSDPTSIQKLVRLLYHACATLSTRFTKGRRELSVNLAPRTGKAAGLCRGRERWTEGGHSGGVSAPVGSAVTLFQSWRGSWPLHTTSAYDRAAPPTLRHTDHLRHLLACTKAPGAGS